MHKSKLSQDRRFNHYFPAYATCPDKILAGLFYRTQANESSGRNENYSHHSTSKCRLETPPF